jgi:hypothetical protein
VVEVDFAGRFRDGSAAVVGWNWEDWGVFIFWTVVVGGEGHRVCEIRMLCFSEWCRDGSGWLLTVTLS